MTINDRFNILKKPDEFDKRRMFKKILSIYIKVILISQANHSKILNLKYSLLLNCKMVVN